MNVGAKESKLENSWAIKCRIYVLKIFSDYCSHQRSIYYYAESVATLDKKTFRAFKCDPFLQMVLGQNQKICRKLPVAYMGFHVDTKLPEGNYYLYTNYAAPFSKNEGLLSHFWFESQ